MTILVIIKTNISSLKAKLSENLEKVKNGETVIVYDRNMHVAKIIPFKKGAKKLTSSKPTASLIDMKLNIKINMDPAEVISDGRKDKW